MITDQFKVLADLGSGATAEVKLVQDVKTQEKFACKVIKTGACGITATALTEVQKEVTIMSQLKHEFIVNTKAVGRGMYDKQDGSQPQEVLFILMEYAPEGELFDMIANTGKFSEPVARYFFVQLLSALSYMHNTVGICHRDLKPENILIDQNFNLKIADWGFSIPLVGQNGNFKLHSYKGTLGYMPPEQHAKKAYSGKAADMFAIAIVLFMMITQCQPFDEARVNDKYYRLIAGNKPSFYWKIFEKVVPISEDLKDLITGMIQLDPSARYTLDELLAHPWLQGPIASSEQIVKEFTIRKKQNDLAKKNNTGTRTN
jgi:serine/threonine protein kinase